MGWRGAVRSIGAAVRAADREAQRRHKAELKQAIAQDAAQSVEEWETFLAGLVSIHTNLAKTIDWHAMANAAPPREPRLGDSHERNARQRLEAFQPKWTDLFNGGSKKIRRTLEQAVAEAPEVDLATFRAARAEHADAFKEWEADRALARQVLAGDVAATKSVLKEMQLATQDDPFIGGQIDYRIEPDFLVATPNVHSIDIVPGFRRKQLASGRLSETKMPMGEQNELYQDYVASVALKVAGDIFQVLLVEAIYVTCETEMVNQQTGHKEHTPILSVHFVRKTFASLQLSQLDPSDAMRNFRHAMAFKRNQGFSRIEPLSAT